MMRLFLVFPLLLGFIGCSYLPSLDKVIPDTRTEYKKSESLPDLEVPPDLTASTSNDEMSIPGENPATLSGYRHQRSRRGVSATGANALTSGSSQDEQWLAVMGSNLEVWPRLRQFFSDKGYVIDIDDAELGVLATDWSPPVSEGGFVYRNKFKVFSEAGAEPGITVLYVSNTRQRQISQENGTAVWGNEETNIDTEKELVGELNLYFNEGPDRASRAVATTPSPDRAQDHANQKKKAELQDVDEGKLLLSMPVEYSYAWRQTEIVLQRAGFVINKKEQDKGLYFISYFESSSGEKKGWMSKLAFWKDDEPQGKKYQISLTGVGDKTELIVLNDSGDWENSDDAGRILESIRDQYNQL